MDFIDKKEKLADLLEQYSKDKSVKNDLLEYIRILENDEEFKSKQLFVNIFNELEKYLDELSNREVKQRVLLIRSFID